MNNCDEAAPTPEMIKAGIEAFIGWIERNEDEMACQAPSDMAIAKLASAVFKAMCQARQTATVAGPSSAD